MIIGGSGRGATAATSGPSRRATAGIELPGPLGPPRRGPLPSRPDHLVFDLDPGPGTSIVECCRVAGWIAERLDGRGTGPVAKASGSKGLQVYVRLSQRAEWEPSR